MRPIRRRPAGWRELYQHQPSDPKIKWTGLKESTGVIGQRPVKTCWFVTGSFGRYDLSTAARYEPEEVKAAGILYPLRLRQGSGQGAGGAYGHEPDQPAAAVEALILPFF